MILKKPISFLIFTFIIFFAPAAFADVLSYDIQTKCLESVAKDKEMGNIFADKDTPLSTKSDQERMDDCIKEQTSDKEKLNSLWKMSPEYARKICLNEWDNIVKTSLYPYGKMFECLETEIDYGGDNNSVPPYEVYDYCQRRMNLGVSQAALNYCVREQFEYKRKSEPFWRKLPPKYRRECIETLAAESGLSYPWPKEFDFGPNMMGYESLFQCVKSYSETLEKMKGVSE